MKTYDCVIIGGGIVGLSTAYKVLKAKPGFTVALLEKENGPAQHQTGHNSGVIHSGIYYQPNSLKAKTCIAGVKQLTTFCQRHDIPINRCGKLIIATSKEELPRLQELHNRGCANGVPDLKLIGPTQIREIEPEAAGIQALHSPHTAIVNFRQVAETLTSLIETLGGALHFNQTVTHLTPNTIHTKDQTFHSTHIINCAGLFADRLAESTERIIPFRGEYYKLAPHKQHLINGLIYPVPDPDFPFLGVHVTRMIDGSVELGPNAVLALAREGYLKRNINLRDTFDTLSYPGFWRLVAKYWKQGCYELYRSYSKGAFLCSLQRLVPSLTRRDLIRAPAGVRAQMVLPSGHLETDFKIYQNDTTLHLLNAPSPAATASLAIADHLVSLLAK